MVAVEGSSATNGTRSNNHTNSSNGSSPSENGSNHRAMKKTATYRHVVAIHSKVQHSCLSRDSTQATSFIGFRNLTIVVLGKVTVSVIGVIFPADSRLKWP